MCRGNWTPDESAALSGDYTPLIDTLAHLNVGSLLLELCTPRAGEMEILRAIPDDVRIGVGICNQKHAHIESLEHVLEKVNALYNSLVKNAYCLRLTVALQLLPITR